MDYLLQIYLSCLCRYRPPISFTILQLGSIKDRNGMDLTEAEDIKKRWQKYTEELYKKDHHDSDNQDSVIAHLEPESWNVKSSGP